MKYFKNEQGEFIDVLEHCVQQLKEHPNLKIHISTDSQNFGSKSVYATVVVFRHGTKGAHYIYNKIKIPRINDVFTRLYKEGELSLECAQYIQENLSVKVFAVEFDYNNKKITKSTNLVNVMKGWAESMGYRALVKPDELIAAKAADHLCRL